MIPLRDGHPAGRFPLWTIAIIALNIYFFYLEITSPDLEAFIAEYALIPSLVDLFNPSTLWSFITSQFLHGGFLHIISNMLFLWIFGDNVEGKLGPIVFPIFYLFCGVVGGLAQYIFMPDSSIPMLGASGAIAGVLGAYFVFFKHHTVKTLIPIFGFFTVMEIPASVMLFYWIITQIFSGVASIGVSFLLTLEDLWLVGLWQELFKENPQF
jgi:membrane associated rhomboid family serine protease